MSDTSLDVFTGADGRDWDTGPDGIVRMAVVGLGNYARKVSLPAIAESDYCVPSVVVSGTEQRRIETAREYDAVGVTYAEYADGTATDEYDAVYVATPNREHLPHVETAAEHGKAVVCEKPLEATADRARQAVEACENAGVTLMTAYRMQTDPLVRRLREFVREGGIGEPIRLFGNFSFDVLGGSKGPDQWRLDEHLAGGGALMDVGVYPLNTARFLLDADPVSVWGTTRTSGPFGDVDEHVDFGVEFPDAVGNFSASFSGHSNAELSMLGTDGQVALRDAFGVGADRTLVVETDDGTVELEGFGSDETVEEFDYFAHCLLTDSPPEPDGRDGLVDVETAMAVYRAAEQGSRVGID
ncbi:D-xylose 1-dehydrogenase (NADP+) [Halalkaliarchaeum desulfuricum]|uniref:D-xylose 1-dehydrogenase (NADP+) n=1 Tax=Halalkaliarchaeum desulfuricum TaxID=2055893 RepID=A0A343TGE8_9EURY|nr:D-xylose 1-dehydrogenase Gfo6 [Halalkaliarchaeum desulfuricum]AUX08170.1 D-xylose 1-dehydrogenase (NADP+) [Halalkaliarchaeum desulfuricum]